MSEDDEGRDCVSQPSVETAFYPRWDHDWQFIGNLVTKTMGFFDSKAGLYQCQRCKNIKLGVRNE